MQYIIIKNPEARTDKFFSTNGNWTTKREEAQKFDYLSDVRETIRALACGTADAVRVYPE